MYIEIIGEESGKWDAVVVVKYPSVETSQAIEQR